MRVVLGRYEMAVPIASSGMGTLWGGPRRLNRKIVIKLIRLGRRQESDAMRRFNREARITAQLSHPGVPVLYDFGTDEGELFMVMEHGPAIEGRPRERHLDSSARSRL
jgi:serine/threonine protein kinase